MSKYTSYVNLYERGIPLDEDVFAVSAFNQPTPGLYRTEGLKGDFLKKLWGFTSKVIIPTAEVLTMNTTPIILVPAQGAGLAIVPNDIIIQLPFNATVYDANRIVEIYSSGSVDLLYSEDILGTPNALFYPPPRIETKKNQIVDNVDLLANVKTGDPTNGDSDLIIYTRGIILEV